jgi:hypothetical protein
MFKKFAVLSILVATTSFAQDITSSSQMKINDSHNFTIALDGASLVLKGAGIKATYAVAEHVSIGGIAKSFQLDSDSSYNSDFDIYGTNEYKHNVNLIGAIVDFFPMGTASERGLYISGGITSATLKTSVKDSFYGNSSARDSKTGGQLTVGYQFVIHLGNSANIMFQTGAGFGNAGAVKWTYSGSKTELRDSLVLDLIGGAQF